MIESVLDHCQTIVAMNHPAFRTLERYAQHLTGDGAASELAEFFNLPAVLLVGEQKHFLATEIDVGLIYSRIKEKS
jgi:hypothetical protein